MKLLIADDSSFMREILKEIFVKEDYKIIEAGNGKEALDKIESENPDLVLLDIIMPELDGIQVLEKAKDGLKVIVISAVGQEKMVEKAKTLGASDYIVKPFDSTEVLSKVQAVLGK